MNNTTVASSLHIHTLDTLLDELVSGRPVTLNDEGMIFQIVGEDARSILSWYRDHRNLWSRNVAKEDVEAIVRQIDIPAPTIPSAAVVSGAPGKRILLLKSVRAHRFGGLHRFGTVDEAPSEFAYTFERPLTLIEGANGAGKTSFLSAILWCLTGYVYCPLRPPELASQAIAVTAVGTADQASQRFMSPITPLPPASVLGALGDTALPLDTWVELTFTDQQGNPVGTLLRKMQRGARNSVVVRDPDVSKLGLDPLACEVGTRMPSLLPYIELGATSDLGTAVAALIGIKPLQDLTTHAQRVQSKLRKDLPKERKNEIELLEKQFTDTERELTELLGREPAISRSAPLPAATSDDAAAQLSEWHSHFERVQAETLGKARDILGAEFDQNNADMRADLIRNVGPALGALDSAQLARLSSAQRLAALGKLSEEELQQAEAVVAKLQAEAIELDGLSQQPAWASRLRLYARVAGWMRDHSRLPHEVDTCPLCQSALDGRTDTVSGKPISDHLREFIGSESQILEKTASAWDQDALARLREAVGPTLQAELNRDLPPSPGALIVAALGQELFQPACLKGCLRVLQQAATGLCTKALARLPRFDEPAVPAFSGHFGSAETALATAVRRLVRAISFARWRRDNESACYAAFTAIVGTAASAHESAETVSDQPLTQRLLTLDMLVKTAEPINHALSKVKALADIVSERAHKREAIKRYERAANAIEELLGLPSLVETQVGYLMKTLSEATARWKESLYSASFLGAPAAVNPTIGPDGVIAIAAAADGAQAPAQHVGNTAELRATLFAFFLAFWEYLLETRGGLALLLLDDPQELFDPPNRRRIASTIPSLAKKGSRIITTTLDPEFARQVKASAGREIGHDGVDHRRIHPTKAIRPHIVLGSFVEAVEEKRRAFEDPNNENEAQPARDYIKELRICIENRLVDFFDLPEPGLPRVYTLSDLLGAIRRRVNSGMEAFADPAFRTLVDAEALAPGSDFLSLLNMSHHGRHEDIQYTDVINIKLACYHVVDHISLAHEAYERWLRRDTREAIEDLPETPTVLRFPAIDAPVFEDIAAFTAEAGPGEAVDTGERFTSESLSHHTLYVVNTSNLGFAAPMRCRAIVDISDDSVADNRLVIAMHRDKIYARRLLRDQRRPGILVLASDAVDPNRRPPSILLPAHEVRLLKIVGILFDTRPQYPRPSQEAELARDMSCLDSSCVASLRCARM
jgi:hypothetical protein